MHLSKKRILILIPAHNEEQSLPHAVEDLRTHLPEADIFVINDASSDETAKVASSLGVACISLPVNLGVGGAMQAGYYYAWKEGYDIAIQFDGDHQHRAEMIPRLIARMQEGHADLVVGSRYLDSDHYDQTIVRRSGTRFFCVLLRVLTRQSFTDPTSGFRAANRQVIAFFAHHYPQIWLGDTVEALVNVWHHNYRIAEVSVLMQPRRFGKSHAANVRGIWLSLCTSLAILIGRFEKRLPQFVRKEENE